MIYEHNCQVVGNNCRVFRQSGAIPKSCGLKDIVSFATCSIAKSRPKTRANTIHRGKYNDDRKYWVSNIPCVSCSKQAAVGAIVPHAVD